MSLAACASEPELADFLYPPPIGFGDRCVVCWLYFWLSFWREKPIFKGRESELDFPNVLMMPGPKIGAAMSIS